MIKKSTKILKRTQSFVFSNYQPSFSRNLVLSKKVLISQPNIRAEKKLKCNQHKKLVKIYNSKLCKIIVVKYPGIGYRAHQVQTSHTNKPRTSLVGAMCNAQKQQKNFKVSKKRYIRTLKTFYPNFENVASEL